MTAAETPGLGVADVQGGPVPQRRPGPDPRVIGLDTSLTATGIASSLGWCTKVGRDDITTMSLLGRIKAIDWLVDEILDHIGEPDLVVIETPSLRSTGGGAVERHALYWLLTRRLIGRSQSLAEVAPTQRIQYAVGKGNAKKGAVIDAVARRLPMFETDGDDNLCDAAVLCAMGCDWLGFPLAVMPAAHRKALGKTTWPEVVMADG